jgi:parallel beta-helix repeat protein
MFGQTKVNAQSLPVHNLNTGLDYATIQDAIDASETVDGNTIMVDAGTYYQPISVYKSVTLVGAGSGATIIDGNGTGILTNDGVSRAIIVLRANDITLMNLTIRNAGLGIEPGPYHACIACTGQSNIDVENDILQNAGSGMVFGQDVSSITINNNTISDIAHLAIDIGGTTNPTATNVTISNNIISDAGRSGINLDGETSNCTILNNTVTDSYYGIDLARNIDTNLVPTDNLIEGNVLDNNSAANILVLTPPYLLQSSYTNTFRQNNLTNPMHYNLMLVGYCAAAFVQDIDSSNTANGKPIYYLTNVNNTEVDPTNCPDAGYLALVNCTNVTVKDFNFTSNNDGVLIAYCTNCTLTNMTMGDNHICITSALYNESFFSDYGGLTLCGSTGNTVVDSTVYNNTCGVCLCNSTGNTFYDNSFINNGVPVVSDLEDPFENVSTGVFCKNFWDNGVEGNYWSGYNGTGSDGIGDTSYVIDANNTDVYPLLGGFSTFSVAAGVDVQVVSNSTISDFQYNGTALLFNVSGASGTTGFCNVCVPTSLLNGTLVVFVNGTQVQYSLLPISNSSNSYIYFTYGHSTEQVIILPEFPDYSLIIAMFMLPTLLTITIHKKKHSRS